MSYYKHPLNESDTPAFSYSGIVVSVSYITNRGTVKDLASGTIHNFLTSDAAGRLFEGNFVLFQLQQDRVINIFKIKKHELFERAG